MTQNLVITEKKQGVATIVLNDPAKMNALSQPLALALAGALEEAWYDRVSRVVVVRGAGGNFSAGGDLKGMKQRVDCYRQGVEPPNDAKRNLRTLNRITAMVRNMDKPVIAWMEGSVAGGGLSLAMACDFSIADENSKLVFAFANIGLAPDMGSSLLMTRRAGMPRTTELFMLGSRFSGRQAADWGIITEAVPADQLEERVTTLARRLAEGPTRSYAAVKAAINRAVCQGLDDILAAETETQGDLVKTEDHMEAVTAFLEKRKPVFQGR